MIATKALSRGKSSLNVSAAAVLGVCGNGATGYGTPMWVGQVNVVTAGSGGTMSVNDCTTTGAAAASNAVIQAPGTAAAGATYLLDWPLYSGLCIVPATGQVLAVTWSGGRE